MVGYARYEILLVVSAATHERSGYIGDMRHFGCVFAEDIDEAVIDLYTREPVCV